jgi:hypothetical protein
MRGGSSRKLAEERSGQSTMQRVRAGGSTTTKETSMGLPALVEAAAAHVRHRVEEDPVGEAGGAGGGGGVQLHGGSARTGGN